MIFLSDIQGTITAIVPDKIYQGSSNAKELILIAPFPRTSAVSVAIRLPNGQLLTPFMADSYKMSQLPDFSPALFDKDGNAYNAWRMQLDAPVTQYGGNVSVQFIIAAGNGVIESSSESTVNIGKGTPYLMPQNVSEWSQVLQSIQQYYSNMKELIEWDFVITPSNFTDAGTFEEQFNSLLEVSYGRVLVKGLSNGEKWNQITIPESIHYIKFAPPYNFGIAADVYGHPQCTIEGFVGMATDTRADCSTLNLFGRVTNCWTVGVYNCLKVDNSEIQHFRYDISGEPHVIDNVVLKDPRGVMDRPAIACVNPDDNVAGGAQTLGNYCTVSNITFINGGVYYRQIYNASSVSAVRRVGEPKITYVDCDYVDGLSCMDYYTAEDDGKAILASADGTKKLKDVYSKEESDKKYVDSEAYNEDLSGLQEDMKTNSDAIDGANKDITADAQAIAVNKAAIEQNSEAVKTLNGYVNESNTGDTGKSVRAIAAEEISSIINAADPEGGKTIENLEKLVKYVDENAGEIEGLIVATGANTDKLAGIETTVVDAIAAVKEEITEVTDGLSDDLDTAKGDIAVLKEKEEWDYVITKPEDFTTENLATMSGRVLVKGGTIDIADDTLSIPSTVTVLEFRNCDVSGNGRIVGSKNTKLIGLSVEYPVDTNTAGMLYISDFGGVEHCKGKLGLSNCENVIHSQIMNATNCTNLTDIYCTMNSLIGDLYFKNCSLINGVALDREDNLSSFLEFTNCSYISNVRDISPKFDPSFGEGKNVIDYLDCTFVDGDTCDGYYTAEDEGKIPRINLEGLKDLILPSLISACYVGAGITEQTIGEHDYGVYLLSSYNCTIKYKTRHYTTGEEAEQEFIGGTIVMFKYPLRYKWGSSINVVRNCLQLFIFGHEDGTTWAAKQHDLGSDITITGDDGNGNTNSVRIVKLTMDGYTED